MKIFYTDYSTDVSVSSADDAIDLNQQQAIESFIKLTEYEDNFWGIITPSNITIQFLNLSTDTWLVDIPDMKKFGSYQSVFTQKECISLIETIFNNPDWKVPSTFTFESF